MPQFQDVSMVFGGLMVGGGFKYMCLFSSLVEEMIHFDKQNLLNCVRKNHQRDDIEPT